MRNRIDILKNQRTKNTFQSIIVIVGKFIEIDIKNITVIFSFFARDFCSKYGDTLMQA